jgi:hypothetical protein
MGAPRHSVTWLATRGAIKVEDVKMNGFMKTTLATIAVFVFCQLLGESLGDSIRAASITMISLGILFDVHGSVFRKIRRFAHG